MNQELLTKLLAGIPGDEIGGQDMAFSDVFDAIREARKEDDPSLAQGEWETELRTAQWPKVKALAEDVLANKSKDLQVAAWYAEAMAKLQGFEGLALGLKTVDGLVSDFWEFCFPVLDPDDLDERVGKIEWLNRQLPMVVKSIPLTQRDTGAYTWLKWEESRHVDNLGLKDPAEKEKAIAEGKLSGEAFDKAAQASGLAYYQSLHVQANEARQAILELEQHVDDKFGPDAPSLKELRSAIETCADLIGRLLGNHGGHANTTTVSSSSPTAASEHASNGTSSIESNVEMQITPQILPAASSATSRGVDSRESAIKGLREISGYFKKHEPHSPVAFLVERAAQWAEMPLDQWLSAVIKDESTLGQLNELLGIRR